MKKLGILGGMGPESTLLYYKEIASKFKERDESGGFPVLTIETVNMYEMLDYCKEGKYEELADYLLQGIRNLEKAGADFVAIASNTPHVVFEVLEREANVPLLSILQPTYEAVRAQGFKKIAWLGIRFSMEQPYFKKIFIENGIDVIVPNQEERIYMDRIIAEELEFGIVRESSKTEMYKIIQRLVFEESVEAVILGCTELPLMYVNEELPVPAFNPLKYHIAGIINHMFRE